MKTDSQIRVLVVDDSAYVRRSVTRMLNSDERIHVVGWARNGREALEAVKVYSPDVVVTDLSMPEMSGVEFIARQMAEDPVPIVVLSVAAEIEEEAGRATAVGALEYISKPTGLNRGELNLVKDELLSKVLVSAEVSAERLRRLPASERLVLPTSKTRFDLVTLGLSTGGPRALESLIQSLPQDFSVPLACVIHMPIGYTQFFSERLQGITDFEVLEAEDGLELTSGRLVIGRAGSRFLVERRLDQLIALTPPGVGLHAHVPSVDDLFRSAADTLGERVLSVVMTGMGRDGTEGAAWVAAQGGTVVAESEESCVVYGMPRSIVERGLADRVAPLSELPSVIVELCR